LPYAQQDKMRLWIWALLPGYLVLHGIIATCLPGWLDPLSTAFIVLAELGAIVAALRASKNATYPVSVFWRLVVCSITLHATAMSLDVVAEATQQPMFNHVPGFQIYFSMLSGVPMLIAVSMQTDRRIMGITRTISSLLSLAIGLMLYLQIFNLVTANGSQDPAAAKLIALLFDVIDVYLAVASTLRWLGSDESRERGFFRTVSIFLWIDALLPAIHNRILMQHDWVWLDLFISAPYVCLFALIETARPLPARPLSPVLVRVVRTGSPIFLTMALVAIGVIASRSNLYEGLAGVLLAIAGYGTLSVFAQSKGLETEESLRATKSRLESLVNVDGLTGVGSRGAFDRVLQREFAAARRTKLPVSLLMIDIDSFKEINDRAGHQAGDEYLITVSAALRSALPRATDFLARYGGDEFSAILPATDIAGARRIAEKLHRSVAALGLHHSLLRGETVTISIGVSTFDGVSRLSAPELVKLADRALYQAKRRGRNRSEFLLPDGSVIGRDGP
jgi:diguanylate cyclase (GGDEF)-like protein